MNKEKSFGETIRELRESNGLLLRQLASRLEVDTAFISKMERSEKKASRELVEKLASIFDIDEHKLLTIWLSDKVLDTLEHAPDAIHVLKLTERRIKQKNCDARI